MTEYHTCPGCNTRHNSAELECLACQGRVCTTVENGLVCGASKRPEHAGCPRHREVAERATETANVRRFRRG